MTDDDKVRKGEKKNGAQDGTLQDATGKTRWICGIVSDTRQEDKDIKKTTYYCIIFRAI